MTGSRAMGTPVRSTAQAREDAYVARFAASFPALAAEIHEKMQPWIDEATARVPAGDMAALAWIEQARKNAFNSNMLRAKLAFAESIRGQGNRRRRRAAAKAAS